MHRSGFHNGKTAEAVAVTEGCIRYAIKKGELVKKKPALTEKKAKQLSSKRVRAAIRFADGGLYDPSAN